jgi:hypothetical protein
MGASSCIIFEIKYNGNVTKIKHKQKHTNTNNTKNTKSTDKKVKSSIKRRLEY